MYISNPKIGNLTKICGCCLKLEKNKTQGFGWHNTFKKLIEVNFNNINETLTLKFKDIKKCDHRFHITCVNKHFRSFKNSPCYFCKNDGQISYPKKSDISDLPKNLLNDKRKSLLEQYKNNLNKTTTPIPTSTLGEYTLEMNIHSLVVSFGTSLSSNPGLKKLYKELLNMIESVEMLQIAIFFMLSENTKNNSKLLQLMQLALHLKKIFHPTVSKLFPLYEDACLPMKQSNPTYYLKNSMTKEQSTFMGYHNYLELLLKINDLVIHDILGTHKIKTEITDNMRVMENRFDEETEKNNDKLRLISKYVKKVLDSFKFQVINERIEKTLNNPQTYQQKFYRIFQAFTTNQRNDNNISKKNKNDNPFLEIVNILETLTTLQDKAASHPDEFYQ